MQSKYTHPQAIIYYLLAAPAMITELVFSQVFASNSAVLASSIQAVAPRLIVARVSIVYLLVLAIPWVLVSVSIYALLSFRPSILITLLTLSFFLLTTAFGYVGIELAVIVVLSSFSALMGFSHARAAKILRGREPRIESRGPLRFRLTTWSMDLGLPIAAALGLMMIVAFVISAIRSQVSLLPQPLSELGTLYLRSHVNLVFTTLAVAGAAVWAMRQLIEPIILRFTLRRQDALEEALWELDDVAIKIRRQAARKPGRGTRWILPAVLALAAVVIFSIVAVGPGVLATDIQSIFYGKTVTPTRPELLLEAYARSIVRQMDGLATTLEDAVRFILKLLWG